MFDLRRLRKSALLLMLLNLFTVISGCGSSPEVTTFPESAGEAIIKDDLIIPTLNSVYYYKGVLYYFKQPLGAAPTRIYYIDPESGESGLLCGKPECTHDTNDCNACIDSYGNGFTIYQDRLYWYTHDINNRKLMCEDLDGTNRREVMALDKESEWFVSDKSFIAIYNDTLYRCGDGNTVTDGEPTDNMLLYCQPLEKGSEPKVLYSAQNVNCEVARIVGNQLYFAIVGANEDLTICTCDLDSGEIKELFYKEKADNPPKDIAVYDNKLILHGYGYCVSIYSLEDGSYTVIGEKGRNYYCATGTKIYESVSRSEYRLYTLNGELIAEGAIDIPGLQNDFRMREYMGSIKETMLFCDTYQEESKTVPGASSSHCYLIAFNTDTLEWKILWDGISDYEGM